MPPFLARAPNVAPSEPRLPIRYPHLRYSIPTSDGSGTLGSRAYEDAQTVPQGYGNAPFGPDSGTVAGIVLGSVAGFLLILALLYWFINIGQAPRTIEGASTIGGTESVVSWRRAPRGPPRRHHRRSKHAGRREKIEIRRERAVPVRVEHEDRIIVEEYQSRTPRSRSPSRTRSFSRGPPPPRSVTSDGKDRIIVEEEDNTPPRRRESVRSQRARRSNDRAGPYRDDYIRRDISRQRSSPRT